MDGGSRFELLVLFAWHLGEERWDEHGMRGVLSIAEMSYEVKVIVEFLLVLIMTLA